MISPENLTPLDPRTATLKDVIDKINELVALINKDLLDYLD